MFTFASLKKLITIFLLGLYGFSVSGATVHLHYCCGDIAAVSVGYDKADGCGDMTMKDMAGCCFDDQVKMNVDDNQGASVAATLPAPCTVDLAPAELPTFEIISYPTAQQPLVEARGSPPLLSKRPLYLRNCVFRN